MPVFWLKILNRQSVLTGIAIFLVVSVVGVTALPLPAKVERFYTPLLKIKEHPIPKFVKFEEYMKTAIDRNIPIISVDSEKPLDTANRVFYDNPSAERQKKEIQQISAGAHIVYYLEGLGDAPDSLDFLNNEIIVLYCDRFNFDMHLSELKQIEKLGDLYGK